ncbi:proline reductase-associated electron transfer protein PrdC [Pseudobutyrivibrio sp. OR37]|uniref:proline reductase-associated electron transfer protein PrdC n=1 Tax=Pseudobutyrivibrio sp. OR37 TaxID=1798186 RepID=UPI0008E51F57|nr:proline reductase-associated electron transfer protein PrdC [Pseudobutyrivibrio sp. OR37]SFH65701.1 proline reductase-associated electron transfer protein PrdC [Pseudobutyrivibrio sp. OR37]
MGNVFEFPLKQHIGNKAAACVVKGDVIHRGQLLALQGDGLGCNIFSSVSGKVLEITDESVSVEADEKQTTDYIPLKSEEPLDLIKEAGLVGLGGAGFPTYAKFAKPFEKGGNVIINAAECEPILGHNIKRIEDNPKQLIRGLEIAMDISNAKHGYIAIKECHKAAIEALKNVNTNSKIIIKSLEDIYPMGEERAVIREVLEKLLPVTALPLEAEAIVINAETACRIQEAVDLKKPLIDKDLTVAGKIKGCEAKVKIQTFLDIPLGKKVSDVFEMAGGLSKEYGELIMGGPFTGKRTNLEKPIIKTTGGLIASECFMKGPEKIGLLVCACGANKERMEQLAKSLGSEVVGVEYCKQAMEVNGTRKCENPGKCPGQVAKVMSLKKAGAQGLLISNCTDCSNTVMSCAPQLGLPVYHCTDQALRAVNHKLIRKIK